MALSWAVLLSGSAQFLVIAQGDDRSGEFGCGVGIAGDWPNIKEVGDATYDFDLSAIMQSAQAKAGRKVWRYDWRGTQYPQWAPYDDWKYVAMDWCADGGKFHEHPDPYGPWPGLMGWNEPNVLGQCDHNAWDVDEFVSLARQYKAVGKFVVSPAPSGDANWLDMFLGVLHDSSDPNKHFMDVDFLAYHHYVACEEGKTSDDDIWNQFVSVIANFNGLIQKWNGQGMHIKGLWMTEVSCGNHVDGSWSGPCGDTCNSQTMNQFVRLIQTHPEIKSWAWFPYDGFGNLWDKNNGYALTSLGEEYFGNCNHVMASNATSIQV